MKESDFWKHQEGDRTKKATERVAPETGGEKGRRATPEGERDGRSAEQARTVEAGARKIEDAKRLDQARRELHGDSGDIPAEGWGSLSRDEILDIRKNLNLGSVSAQYDIGVAKLAQGQLDGLRQELDRLRTKGVQETSSEWQKCESQMAHYQRMLDATAPEARPLPEDSALERATKSARQEYQRISDEAEPKTGLAKVLAFFSGPKGPTREMREAQAAWQRAKKNEDTHTAEKILKLAEARNLPSSEIDGLNLNDKVGPWSVAYVTDGRGGSRAQVILQKGAGGGRELMMVEPEALKNLSRRAAYLEKHPDQRTADDIV